MEKLKPEKEMLRVAVAPAPLPKPPKPRAPLIIRPPRPGELPVRNKRPRPPGVAFTQLWERTEIKESRDD